MARHTGTTDLDPRSTTMLSTAELNRLQAALGACRAHGCDCTSYEAAGKVGNYPTCKCGHSENVHNHPDGGKAPAKKTGAAWHEVCPSCGSKDVWPHDKWTQTCGACGIVFDEEGHTWGDMWLYENDDFDEGLHEGSLRRQAVTTALWPVTGYGDLVHVVLGNPEDTDSAPEATKTALCGQTPWGFNYWKVMPFDGEDYRPVSNAEDARQVTCPTCRRAAETSVRTASRKTALGETRMPAEVDTLREDSCPICGADDYRGDACNSCGFVRPPVIFHDPDTQKARVEDLREPPTPVDLACDACGAVFPATTEQAATASRHHAAIPEDLEKDKATGTTTDQSDPQATAGPEQAEPTAAEQVRQHQQGDLCPSCGKGTLMPKSEVNGVEADEDQVVSEDGEIEEPEEPASEGGGGYTLLPKDDPQAILDLVGGGAPKVASVRTATIPSPYEDEEPKKKPEPADDTGSGGPEPEVEAEANPVEAGTEDEGGEKAGTDVQADVPEEVEDAAPEADEAPEETTEDVVEDPAEGESEASASGGLSDPAGVGPSDGYLVVDTASAQTFDLATVTAEEIAAYTSAHPEGYLGGTVSDGQLTLEVSTHVTDPDQATGGTVWDVAAGTKVEPEETPQQVAAALTRRLLSYRRPVRCAPTGTERVEEPIPHRLSGRTQKEQSMSTQNPERGGDRRRQSRPQRRQASAEGRPQRPRQGLHQTLSAMEQRMDRMASVIQRQAGEIKELRTGTRVLAAQNEVLRTAALALSETDGSEAALKATAGLRKAAEQGGAKNGEDVALTDESAAAPEATTSVDSDETVATGDVTPDATTDVENTQVAEDQGALNELTDVTQAHPQTGDATGEVQVQKSAPATTEEANPIEESGWTTASKTDSDDERTWAAMHLAKTRKDAGLTNEETMVLAQRLTKDASITVEAMETEAKTLEQVMATKEGSRRPGRNLVPRRADGGAAPSLAGARTASAEEQASGGDVDVSDAFI